MQIREEMKKLEQVTNEILQQVKQLSKLQRHKDFSFLKLLATVVQILVFGMIFWVIVGIDDIRENTFSAYTLGLKLMGAILLQLIALTFYTIDRR